MMWIYTEILLLFLILVLLVVKIGLDWFYQPDIPDPDDLVKDLYTKFQKSDAQMAGSTAKQKKALQQMLGKDLIAQYPIIEMIRPRLPSVADYLEKYPGAVPLLGEILNTQVSDKVLGKLPPELQAIAQQILGIPSDVVQQSVI